MDLYKDYSESALAQSRIAEEEVSDGPKEESTPQEAEAEQTRIAAFKAQAKRGRRGTVFVASEAPVLNFVPPVHEKSPEQSNKLFDLLEGAKLLKYLDVSSKLTVVRALFRNLFQPAQMSSSRVTTETCSTFLNKVPRTFLSRKAMRRLLKLLSTQMVQFLENWP